MNDTVSEKLEPCPFCGCDDVGTESTATDGSVWCNGCRARITKLHYHPRLDIGQRDAIAAWNRRAYLAATKPPLADVTVKANDPHFYQLTDGSFAPYPHGMTGDEWNTQIGDPSYEHAKDLPND